MCVCGHDEELHQPGYACAGKTWHFLFLDKRFGQGASEGPCDCLEYVWDESAWQEREYERTGVWKY